MTQVYIRRLEELRVFYFCSIKHNAAKEKEARRGLIERKQHTGKERKLN